MKILLVGAYGTLHREEAIERGFLELGANVRACKYGDILFNLAILSRIQFKIGFGPEFKKIEYKVQQEIIDFQPEVVFFRRPLEFSSHAIKRLRKITSALFVSYNNDDPFSTHYKNPSWYFLRKAIKEYDLHFAFRKKNIAEYYNAEAKKVYLWEPYYVPWLHLVENEPCNNGKIFFAMHAEKDWRKLAVENLISNKLPVEIHSWNWEKVFGKKSVDKLIIKPPIWGKEYVQKISESMATLCFFSKQNNDELTSRVFEIPAAGGLLIAERNNRLSEIFEDGEDVFLFSSTQELVEKCLFLKNNPQMVLQMKKNARNKLEKIKFSIVDRCDMAMKIFEQEIENVTIKEQ
jgi:spore maturation protein CgeB